MAESYRGLTIRIGGDTTGITKALRTADQAIAGTRQELKKIGDALKLDPGNVEAYSLQMGYMANQAAATSMRLYQLKDAADQIGKDGIKLASGNISEPIEKLAAATKDAHMQAAQAKSAYNKVTDSLSDMYTTLSKYNEKVAETATADAEELSKKLGVESSIKEIEEFGRQLEALFTKYDGVVQRPKQSIDEIVEALKKFHNQYVDTESAIQQGKLDKKFDDLIEKVTQLSGVKVNFDADNTDISQINAITDKLRELKEFGFDDSQLDKYIDEVYRLKDAYNDAMDQLQQANAVAQFVDLQAEIIKTEASVKSIAKAIANMKEPSQLLRGMNETTERVKVLEKEYETLINRAKSLESAYSIDNSNEEAREEAMKAYAEAELLAIERAEELRKKIGQYDRSKIDEYTDATKSATKQLADASLEHEKATTKVSAYKGIIETTSKYLKELKLDASEVAKVLSEDLSKKMKGLSLDEAEVLDKEKVREQIAILEQLAEAFGEASKAAADAGDMQGEKTWDDTQRTIKNTIAAFQNLAAAEEDVARTADQLEYSKQRSELDGLDAELVKTAGDADKARVSMQQLAAGEVKLKIDTTEIDKIKESKKDLDNYGSSVGKSLTDISNDLKVIDSVTSGAIDRANKLFEAFAQNPGNIDALTLGINATGEAMTGCIIKSEQLQKIIAGYTPDKIDEVAIATNTVGINAERAAHDVEEAFRKMEDAQKNVEKLTAKYKEALASAQGNEGGAENSIVKDLKRQLDEAKEELEDFEDAAENAIAALDVANATKELVRYREEVHSVAQEYQKAADVFTTALKSDAVSGAFGDTSDIDDLVERFKAASTAAGDLAEASKLNPDNIEVFNAKVQALAEKEHLAEEATRAIQQAMSGIDASKVDDLSKKYGSVSTAVKATTTAVTAYKMQLGVAQQEFEKLVKEKGLEDVKDDILSLSKDVETKLTPEIIEARDAVLALSKALENVGEDFNTAAVVEQAQRLSGQLAGIITEGNKNLGAGIDEAAFQQALARVSQVAEQAAQRIVESANTIDSAYRDMRKTVEGTEEQFKSLHDEAIAFSQTHAVSADSLLEIEALGGQLGIAAGKLQSFGEAVSSVVIATDLAAEDAALKFGQLTNVMSDLDDSTFENLADVLVRLGNTTATTESQIMEVAQRMSAVANVTSMTTPQLMAWSAAIASTGMHSESAATSITRTITGIGQAVAEGGQTLQKFAQIAGMSADEFKQKWETSSSEALEAFIKGLARLDDSSTDMIQALDDVGISSVRQETSLLALTQTIGNLNGAMENATDAWTNGGDAAHEAEEKSKGFSGSLAILQNNAQDLAASLGDGLVPVMDVLSSALNIITDTLNIIPGPLKTVIVSVGGLSAILGTTYPVIHQINEALKGTGLTVSALPTILKAAAGGSEALATAFKGVAASEVAAADAAKAFSSALTATGIGVAITLALALINEMVNAYQEWETHTALVEKATTGLEQALSASSESYSQYNEKLKETSRTTDEIRAANEKAVESVASLADTISSTLGSVGENAAAVDHYAEAINNLGNQGSITSDDLALLKNAVEQYNSITGAAIEITDESTGALNIGRDAINEITDAYKEFAQQQAYLELYNETIKKQAENEMLLEKNKNELAAAEEELTRRYKNHEIVLDDHTAKTNALRKENEDLLATQSSLADTEEYLAGKVNDSSHSYGELETAMVSAGQSLNEFNSLSDEQKAKLREIEAALNATGSSLTDYGYLTASQLSTIVSDWDGTASSVIASLKKIQDAANQTKAEIKSANDSLVTEFKRGQEDEYNSLKRQLDDAYTARKNNLDDQYNALKNELDDEYNAVKSSLDKQYNEHKKVLDKEYDEHKKVLDKKYDARKEELDKEYDAAKEASDQYLKDLKEKLDEEVDAYKDATDEKIAEMKREYEAKKKFIEDAEDERLSDLDAQIDAIEAEQKAEDKARKKQQQQEKLEELKQAAYDAKTKKDQEKAVKAYYDYVEDLEAEYRKEQRQEAIQTLKDAKENVKEEAKQRQEALKESYETATEQYKADREANLEILKKNTEKEYEQAKKGEEAKLALVKKAHETELSMLKESNEAELESHKESNEAILAAEKESNDAYLAEKKRNNEAILAEQKRANEAALTNLKRQHEDQLKQLKRDQEDELKAIKEGLEKIEEAAEEESAAMSEGAKKLLDIMRANGVLTAEEYQNALNGVPGAMKTVFEKAGLATDEGTKRIASYMYRNGELTVQQYLDIMNGVPGATDELFTDAALVAAEKLGLIPGSVDEVGTKMSSAADIAMKGFNEVMAAALNESVTNAANLPGNMADGITANSDKPKIAASAVMDGIGGVLKGGEDLYNSIGQKIDTGVASGISSSSDQPVLAAHGMLDNVIMLFDSIGLTLEPRGELIPAGIASGVAQGAGTLSDTAIAMMQNLYATLDTGENTATIGRNLPLWYASGISETADQPLGIVQAMMEGAYKVLDSGDNTSAYGKTIPVGYASGIAEEAGAPVEVTGKMMETLYEAMGQTDNTDTLGKNFMIGYANGIAQNADKPVKSTAETTKAMLKYMDIHESTDKVGKNAAIGFNNGFVSYANNVVIPAIRRFAQSVVSAMQNMLKIHSPSREFEWLAEMTLKGFEQGWSGEQGTVLRMADSTASALIEAMANQDFDVTGQLIDSMRSKEQELAAQSKRMADIVENGFDPRLTVDAAYEAIDRINAGELRKQQVVAAQDVQNPVMTSPTVILNVSQVIVREEADIEAIANKLALKVNRSISSRIG